MDATSDEPSRRSELWPLASRAAGYVTCTVVRFETAKRASNPTSLPARGLPKLLSSVNRGIAIEQIARMACPLRGHFGGAKEEPQGEAVVATAEALAVDYLLWDPLIFSVSAAPSPGR